MQPRIALPLVLLLASGCAQLASEGDGVAADRQPSAQATPATPAPLPELPIASPKLQPATELVAVPPPDAEAPPKSLWPRITGGFAMAPMDNDLVREWENWYASRPDYVERMINRSSHFLFHIVEQVEKRGMPMEIALLPMIESAYNPIAYSRSHASGIWQFIPSTGKDFGLRQNWWYDGRRDVIAATEAALDYLEKLHGMFGDWQLALASYNWGEGAVGRAMERNRAKGLPTDYESLTVPPETRSYVPKLVAVKNIISNPARYGLTIADVPNEPYFDTVTVQRHIDMKLAAKLAEIPLDEFKFLNPGHNKPVIKAGEAERIVLPRHKVATFLENFEKHDEPLVSWRTVTVRSGQKAEQVAAQHGMTLTELKQVNGLAQQRRIVAGQPLLVPLQDGDAEPHLPDLPATPLTLPKAIKAAKASAKAKRFAEAKRKGGVRKVAQKRAVRRGKGKVVVRAASGRKVKVSQTARKAAKPTKRRVSVIRR
jgi:membrane-bound lytic murein transglycosylase D